MSLVYDSLRQPAADAAAVARGTPSPHGAPWRDALAGYRRPALWLLCGMLVAGPLGFLLSRPATVQAPLADANPAAAEPATPAIATAIPAQVATDGNAPVAAAAVAAPAPTAADATPVPAPIAGSPAIGPATLVATSAAAIAAAPAAAATDMASATAVEPAPANTVTAPPAGAGAQTEVQVVASQIKVSVRRRDAANAAEPTDDDVDPRAVREAMAALDAAVGAHDAAANAAAIARLQALLPSGSLTLLRARAWAAHGGGDFAEAERLYRAILERVPDDEHAEVNLALLDARRGDVDDARARLDRLAARNARSPQVLQAIAELDAARR
jgi:tetratricopeptide (TPR) repeat protein